MEKVHDPHFPMIESWLWFWNTFKTSSTGEREEFDPIARQMVNGILGCHVTWLGFDGYHVYLELTFRVAPQCLFF